MAFSASVLSCELYCIRWLWALSRRKFTKHWREVYYLHYNKRWARVSKLQRHEVDVRKWDALTSRDTPFDTRVIFCNKIVDIVSPRAAMKEVIRLIWIRSCRLSLWEKLLFLRCSFLSSLSFFFCLCYNKNREILEDTTKRDARRSLLITYQFLNPLKYPHSPPL